MIPVQDVLKVYKTCAKSSEQPAHHLDITVGNGSQKAPKKKSFPEVLRENLRK